MRELLAKVKAAAGKYGPYPEGVRYLGAVYALSYAQSATALRQTRVLKQTQGEKEKPFWWSPIRCLMSGGMNGCGRPGARGRRCGWRRGPPHRCHLRSNLLIGKGFCRSAASACREGAIPTGQASRMSRITAAGKRWSWRRRGRSLMSSIHAAQCAGCQ